LFKIAVLASGGGSNLQSIIDSIKNGYLKDVSIEYVITDKEDAFALNRAEAFNIKTMTFKRAQFKENLSDKIYEVLKDKVDLIVLAGFLSIIKGKIVEEFKDRIINIHPSLIPSFCGRGMYGLKVHEAAIDYGVKVSGCTVHFIDEGTDTGAIILQKTVEVQSDDTSESLQKRILMKEHSALPEVIKLISEGKVQVHGRKVTIKE
jgi:phosphoribosylglycinamide formyltransferase-1